MISEITTQSPIGKSHHLVLTFEEACYIEIYPSKTIKYFYDKANYDAMSKSSQIGNGDMCWVINLLTKTGTLSRTKFMKLLRNLCPGKGILKVLINELNGWMQIPQQK